MNVASLAIESPAGSAWEFLVLFLVVILGPPLVERARVPGLIGLLIGGFLIGPHGLALLDEGSTTIPDLGELGLLYLMFVAGVELDLALLRRHRRSAIGFGLLTFVFPMAFGTLAGALLGWELAAALLLGSLLASHTLVLYPIARGAGIANDPLIASAVGATVLTDTVALIVLAVISGSQTGSGGGTEVALQIGLGLLVLLVFAFAVLPPLARRAFRLLGTERTVRYVIAVAAFLGTAVVAEMFEIEGIVGAFFAGLAMNRLVPNEGPLMSRIDFFGVAVFVPVFLVSVGLLLDPSVMFRGETLALAGLFVAACLGGKLVAATLTRPLFGASGPQSLMVFALTTPQAAATLAATTVGFQIGLFSEAVVNAVLVLILVSVLVSTLVAEREKSRVDQPAPARRALGEHALVVVSDLDAAPLGMRLAAAVTEREAGFVDVVLLGRAGVGADRRQAELDRLSGICRRLGIDADPVVRVSDHEARTAVLAANDLDASLVIAVEGSGEGGGEGWSEAVALALPAPVAIVRGQLDLPLEEARVLAAADGAHPAGTVVAELVAALTGVAASLDGDGLGADLAALGDGEVAIAAVTGWEPLAALRPPAGAAAVLVPDGLLPGTSD
ncbi:MAG: cation:proton antiporter [Solirubrobacterales bacterium]